MSLDYDGKVQRGGCLRGIGVGMAVVSMGIAVCGVIVGVGAVGDGVLNWMGKWVLLVFVVGMGMGIGSSVILGCLRRDSAVYGVLAVVILAVELGGWFYLGGWAYFT